MTIDYRENAIYTVYIHISPSNKYYVGLTKLKPSERWGMHGQMYKKQAFYNAIIKYGWNNFQHEIIAEHLTRDEACQMERTLIKVLDSNGSHGYNQDEGGTYDYKPRINLVGKTIGKVFVDKIIDVNSNGIYEYDCICNCGNHRILNQQQLLYTKKYISCKDCEKEDKPQKNVKEFIPNTEIVHKNDYIEVYVSTHKILCDKCHYDLMKTSSLNFEYDKDNVVQRIRLYSPLNQINRQTSISTVLFHPPKNKLPIHINMDIFDFRSSNISFVSYKNFTIFHHLYNNRNNPFYLIEKRINKQGIQTYKPSSSLYTGIKIQATTNLNDAISLRNRLIREKYKNVKELQQIILFYYTEKEAM